MSKILLNLDDLPFIQYSMLHIVQSYNGQRGSVA
jgi:hypothetical protein